MRAAAWTLLLALVVACGPAPTPSPESMTGVLNELAAHGATVTDVLAGDPGCAGSPLRSNASRLTLVLAADGREYHAYLFRWRRPADYEAASEEFSLCVAAFVTANGSTEVEVVEVPPWRAYGPGWTAATTEAVEGALAAAAGGP